ncbi:MAG: hypothetical protein ACFFAN_17570 [Promethearchaeota archaeon]
MSKVERVKKKIEKREISGSETISEKIKSKTPWIFGKKFLRKPKIIFPKFRYRHISISAPSKSVGLIIIYILLFILQTGIVYLIYKEPRALGATREGDPIWLHPGVSDSFIIEGIVASVLIFVSSTGFILLYQASKHSYNRKLAIEILIIGALMILVTFVALQYMINEKL